MTAHANPTNPVESVRAAWSETDEQFFRITAELVSPAYAMGAGVLLASYDPEPVAPDPRPAPPTRATPRVPAARPAPAAASAQQ